MNKIGKILQNCRKERGLQQQDVSKALDGYGIHVGFSAVSAWERGVAVPNTEQFLALCRIYGITDIYNKFIGGHNPDDPLSDLNDDGKKKALDYIRLLNISGEYRIKEGTVIAPFRTLPVYLIPVSAGTGDFLDSDDYDLINVGNEVPDSASFGVRIHGDSMEPRFVNGQIVWVQQTQDLCSGDIGVFYLDGNSYCKVLQNDQSGQSLSSLNSDKYSPIHITVNSDFKVFGKVVG